MGEKEEALLERAEAEEEAYNWKKAANLYERYIKLHLTKDKMEKTAEIYKRIGFVNARAANTSDTAEEYLEHNNNALNAYKEAGNIYKRKKNKSGELECKAEVFLLSGFIKKTVNEAKEAFKMAYELFTESKKLCSKQKDQENAIRIFVREMAALYLYAILNNDKNDIEQAHHLSYDNFPTELESYGFNIQYITEAMFYLGNLIFIYAYINDFKYNELISKLFQKLFLIY
jgi:hypothetical protein